MKLKRTMSKKSTQVFSNSPIMEVNSSGAELPAAMNVAPATSSENPSFCKEIVYSSSLNLPKCQFVFLCVVSYECFFFLVH